MTTMKRFDELPSTEMTTKEFLIAELSAAIAKVEGKKVDVRPEIRVWLTGNRKTNESYNAGLSDAITIFKEHFGL